MTTREITNHEAEMLAQHSTIFRFDDSGSLIIIEALCPPSPILGKEGSFIVATERYTRHDKTLCDYLIADQSTIETMEEIRNEKTKKQMMEYMHCFSQNPYTLGRSNG